MVWVKHICTEECILDGKRGDMESSGGRVKEIVHLLIVDLQEGALTEELHKITILLYM